MIEFVTCKRCGEMVPPEVTHLVKVDGIEGRFCSSCYRIAQDKRERLREVTPAQGGIVQGRLSMIGGENGCEVHCRCAPDPHVTVERPTIDERGLKDLEAEFRRTRLLRG